MSLSQFYVVLSLAVVMPISAVRFTAGPWQSVSQEPASVTINPREATVHVGETQSFEVIVKGTQSSGVQWAVKERNGGCITEDGTYTAPRHVGLYHVVAISEEDPAARSVAKVTVVTEYDTPDAQERR